MKKLFRAHGLSELPEQQGIIANPYLNMPRKPRDTPIALHCLADSWFEQKFGLCFRSRAIFCSGNRAEVEEYCDNNYVLVSIEPVDDYKLCYSPKCPDMYRHFNRVSGHPWQQGNVWRELDSLQYKLITNASWDDAVDSHCEIMMYAMAFKYKREDV